VEKDEEISHQFFFFSKIPLKRKILVKIHYETLQYESSTEKAFEVQLQSPFNYSFNFYSAQFTPISPVNGVTATHPLFIQFQLQPTTTLDLQLLDTKLNLHSIKGDPVASCIGSSSQFLSEKSPYSKDPSF
jgi:hypothetical protein